MPSPVLRLGLIGGGPGSFIGPVHRMAAELDGRFRLVAGAFSSDPERSRQGGASYGVDPDRAYPSYAAMIAAERERADGIDAVAIVTPNHVHGPASTHALRAGLHVMCDKPAALSLAEMRDLADVAAGARGLYALTHTYTGYPLVREARALVAAGRIGRLRKVVVEYSQGWLSTPLETTGLKQAGWRTDPSRSGAGGCIGDIGVHAFNLAEFVTGKPVARLCADLSTLVPGRRLDDDCNILLRFDDGTPAGVPGVLHASQIAAGDRNGLRLRVFGTEAGIDWSQETPNTLTINGLDGRTEVLHAGGGALGAAARAATRLPIGHPEGYIEAFANLYRDFAAAIHAGRMPPDGALPGVDAGLRGMAFIETAVANSATGGGWVQLAV
ncbi:Gfo/Idh/MocA family protein [Nitrospirillum viridazoti]|uniref:Oxidoreductase n=1 Tax=Nitrospirillum viridazoti CBAmc TaxID=1441467 RepID=A0A248JPW0_9PROT|nr:Gfo/Idh/MocA family oxidoreductase [Nitrospirillum amazonense]ASG20274.1 oxidoreductase [Nitrospirillum amazonense CBAmc]TWB27966.1 putative dehydrogenase [Nitrospirillum amazonense]